MGVLPPHGGSFEELGFYYPKREEVAAFSSRMKRLFDTSIMFILP
jgi:hypothetical protein